MVYMALEVFMAANKQVTFQGFQFPTIPVLDKVFGILTPQLSIMRTIPLLTIISILKLLTFSSDGVIFSGAYAAGTLDKEKKHELSGDFARFTDNLKENRFLLNQNIRPIVQEVRK
jgi:hypothetical protein